LLSGDCSHFENDPFPNWPIIKLFDLIYYQRTKPKAKNIREERMPGGGYAVRPRADSGALSLATTEAGA
jgi:hypothetical protein